MKDYKIINKRETLIDVVELGQDTVLLKFDYYVGFNLSKDIYVLTIHKRDIFNSIRSIRVEYLNGSTVIIEEDKELVFYSGDMDKPFGWSSSFETSFDSYEESFVPKSEDDYNNELLFLIGDAVRTKAFQSVMNSDFLDELVIKMQKNIDISISDLKEKERLKMVLRKIRNLDKFILYSALMYYNKFDLKEF